MDAAGATGGKVYFEMRIAQHNSSSSIPIGTVGTLSLSGLTHKVELTAVDRQVSDTIQRPEDKLPAVTIADLILEICQRYGYTVNYNTNTAELVFNNSAYLGLRSLSTDWNDKIESPLDSQFGTQYQTEFVFGSYGEINQYKSADGTDVGVLLANVTNNDIAEAYTSIFDIPTSASLNGIEYTKVAATDTGEVVRNLVQDAYYLKGDVVHFCGNWFKAKVDTQATTTAVPGRYYVIQDTFDGLSIDTDWELIPATSAFSTNDVGYIGKRTTIGTGIFQIQNEFYLYGFTGSTAPRFNNDSLTWQSALDTNYQWLSAILSKPRVHKVLLQLRATDLPFDFSKPVYWNCAYWYVLSIQDYNPLTQESCVAVIAQIPDYPTS
jgi:hypothetical protein